MRKIGEGVTILILLLVLFGFAAGCSTEASPILRDQQTAVVDVGSTTVNLGDEATVAVTVMVPADTPYGTGEFLLTYDPALLTATGCQLDTAFFGVCNPAVAGEIRWNALAPTGFEGQSTMVTFTFEAEQAGTAELDLTVSFFADLNGSEIEFSSQNGQVEISSESVTPEPTASPTPVSTLDPTACINNPSVETCPQDIYLAYIVYG